MFDIPDLAPKFVGLISERSESLPAIPVMVAVETVGLADCAVALGSRPSARMANPAKPTTRQREIRLKRPAALTREYADLLAVDQTGDAEERLITAVIDHMTRDMPYRLARFAPWSGR